MKYDAFIDVKGKLANELDFLAKAVSDDKTRYVLMNMHIEPLENGEGLRGVATDGHHLHIVSPLNVSAEVFGLRAGYWKVLKNTQDALWMARLDDEETKGLEFPKWQKVVPDGKAVYETAFKGFTFSGRHACELATFIHDFPDATAINLTYLADLGTGREWKVEWYGAKNALKFSNGSHMAIIATMQIMQEQNYD